MVRTKDTLPFLRFVLYRKIVMFKNVWLTMS